MTDLLETSIVVLVVLAIIGSFLVLSKWWAKKKLYSMPSAWTNIGDAPMGVETALKVIKEQLPGWYGPYGGVIEWVSDPFLVEVNGKPILAAGTVIDATKSHIKVMYFKDVSQCALAHEIKHVYESVYNHGKITDGDPKLYAWVNETNAKIKAAVG